MRRRTTSAFRRASAAAWEQEENISSPVKATKAIAMFGELLRFCFLWHFGSVRCSSFDPETSVLSIRHVWISFACVWNSKRVKNPTVENFPEPCFARFILLGKTDVRFAALAILEHSPAQLTSAQRPVRPAAVPTTRHLTDWCTTSTASANTSWLRCVAQQHYFQQIFSLLLLTILFCRNFLNASQVLNFKMTASTVVSIRHKQAKICDQYLQETWGGTCTNTSPRRQTFVVCYVKNKRIV